jgi:hypothetical protein
LKGDPVTLYTTIHLYNVPVASTELYVDWFDGTHRRALEGLRGFLGADRFEVTDEQLMPNIPQPWRFLSIYDFDLPDPLIDLPALAPVIAEGRDNGLVADDETERMYSYRLHSNWKRSPNWKWGQPFSGVSIILGNYVPGRFEEYQRWYDEIHSVEVINVPGQVAMKRGVLSEIQLEPRRYCPGDQLVITAQQTDDLAFTIADFADRANGRSPSGIAMEPRSSSGSTARTVHFFRKISGTDFWNGGVAYAGDLAPYGRG